MAIQYVKIRTINGRKVPIRVSKPVGAEIPFRFDVILKNGKSAQLTINSLDVKSAATLLKKRRPGVKIVQAYKPKKQKKEYSFIWSGYEQGNPFGKDPIDTGK